MTLRRTGAALGCVAALALAGCGDDEGTTQSVAPSTETMEATVEPSTTSTQESSTPPEATVSTTEATVAPPPADEPTTSTTTPESGGYDPDKPDAEDNDKPPEPGSPEEAFEEACEADAKACG